MMSPNYYEFSVFSSGKTPSIRAYHVSGTWYMTHVITRRGGSVRQRALNAVPLCTRTGSYQFHLLIPGSVGSPLPASVVMY